MLTIVLTLVSFVQSPVFSASAEDSVAVSSSDTLRSPALERLFAKFEREE